MLMINCEGILLQHLFSLLRQVCIINHSMDCSVWILWISICGWIT